MRCWKCATRTGWRLGLSVLIKGSERALRLVVVCDFNQLAIRRLAKVVKARDGEQYVRTMAEATVFEPPGAFEGEVTTALSYLERAFALSPQSVPWRMGV